MATIMHVDFCKLGVCVQSDVKCIDGEQQTTV